MKKAYSASPLVAQSERVKQDRRIAKKREDPDFRSQLQTMRQKLAGGQSLYDIRQSLGIKRSTEWEDLTRCLANSFSSPEFIWLEWSVRQNARYSAASDMLNRARKENNLEAEARAIMIQISVDKEFLELQKSLGLIRPISDGNGGTGYSSGDLADAEDKFTRIVEERIISKLEAERTVESPIPLQLLIGSQSGGEPNQLEEATLVEDPTTGRES